MNRFPYLNFESVGIRAKEREVAAGDKHGARVRRLAGRPSLRLWRSGRAAVRSRRLALKTREATFQSRAKSASMVVRWCYAKGCTKGSTYTDGKGLGACAAHRSVGMVPREKCYAKECTKKFSFTDGKGLKACAEHRLENMVNKDKARGGASKNFPKVRKQNKGPGGKSAKKTTLKRLKRKTKSRASSVSSQESDSCSSCSSVTSNSSNSIASRAEKIGKVWQTNKGAPFFLPLLCCMN
jgi:hypothetical protein